MSPSWGSGPLVWVVHLAAGLAPNAICERLEEEWLADLSALDGLVFQLLFALGCCRAALALRFGARRDRIRADAFAWLSRLRRGLKDEEGSELRQWLRRRPHRAFITREASNRDSHEDLAVLGKMFPLNHAWVMPRQGRSRTQNVAAASIATCIASLPLIYIHHSMPGLILSPALEGSFMEVQGTVYTTERHALRRIVLADGTRVVMNRGTRIAVLYSENIRSVLLVRGEATFTVPGGKLGSFGLTAGSETFGTVSSRFNVSLNRPNAIELTVLDGTVMALKTHAVPTLLKAGQIIDMEQNRQSTRAVSRLEAQARIAWQHG